MRVIMNTVGLVDNRTITWPEDWPIPNVGDEVTFLRNHMIVKTVDYHPEGSIEDPEPEPFVYIIIGPRRASF